MLDFRVRNRYYRLKYWNNGEVFELDFNDRKELREYLDIARITLADVIDIQQLRDYDVYEVADDERTK